MTDTATLPRTPTTTSTTTAGGITYPLISPDRTCLPLYHGLDRYQPPSLSHITEPAYTADDLSLITQARTQTLAHIAQHGLTTSPALHSPIATTHWRDIYHANRHKTSVTPTPDPRLSPSYSPPPPPALPDHLVHTFLVGKSRKLDAAVRQLLDYCHWWVVFGVADLCAQPACPFGDKVAEFYPERMHGLTKDGRPLVVQSAGSISLAAYYAAELPPDCGYVIQTYKREWMRRMSLEASAITQRRINDVTLVTDLDHFTFAHRHGVPWVKALAFIDKAFYPETAYSVVVINAPGFFTFVFGLIKGFIDERTQEKITFLGSDYRDTLIAKLGSDSTPQEWGGTCTLEHAGLPQLLRPDPAAEAARQAAVVRGLEGGGKMEEVTLHPRASHVVTHRVEGREGTGGEGGVDVYVVWWSWKVVAKDVDFAVAFHPLQGQGDVVHLVPSHRVAAGEGGGEDGVVRGCCQLSVGSVNEGGDVVITWSNGFSMWSSKQVQLQSGVKKN